MPVATMRRRPGIREHATKVWKAGKKVQGWVVGEERARRASSLSEKMENEGRFMRISAEEELETLREKRLDKMLKRMGLQHPEKAVAFEELMEQIQEEMQQGADARDVHRMLGGFFSANFPNQQRANIARIKAILMTIDQDYVQGQSAFREV